MPKRTTFISTVLVDEIGEDQLIEMHVSQNAAMDTAKRRWTNMGRISRNAHVNDGKYCVVQCVTHWEGRFPTFDIDRGIVLWDPVGIAKRPLYTVYTREGSTNYPSKGLAIDAAKHIWEDLPSFYKEHGIKGRPPVIVWEYFQEWDEDEEEFFGNSENGAVVWSGLGWECVNVNYYDLKSIVERKKTDESLPF